MKHTKFYMGGLRKPDEEQNKDCPVCRNGEIFEREYLKTGEFEEDNKEMLCNVCVTKYVFPKVDKISRIHPLIQKIKESIQKRVQSVGDFGLIKTIPKDSTPILQLIGKAKPLMKLF